MLQMRPGCECCDRDLAPDVDGALICSFECTWCPDCLRDCLGGRCPNCGDVPVPRPLRTGTTLARHPASTERVLQPGLHRG